MHSIDFQSNSDNFFFGFFSAKDTCYKAAEVGTCQNYEARWYFDTKENRCRQFYYGGCGGNENNFVYEEDCMNECHQSTTDQAPAAITHADVNVTQTIDIFVPTNCEDSKFFANCNLIVKAKYCTFEYYAQFCCRSCTLAQQLSHIQEQPIGRLKSIHAIFFL